MRMRRSILSHAERVEESLAFLSPILFAIVLAIRIAHLAMSRFRARA